VIWVDSSGGSPSILGRSFGADGRPLDGAFQLNLTMDGNQLDPAIAATPDGGAVVVWVGVNVDPTTTSVFLRLLRPN